MSCISLVRLICGSIWGFLSSLLYHSNRLLVVIWLSSIIVQSLPVLLQYCLLLLSSVCSCTVSPCARVVLYVPSRTFACTLPSLNAQIVPFGCQCLCDFIWLVVSGYVRLSGYLWLSVVIVGYRWLSVVIVGYLWLLLVIVGYRWLSVVIVGYLWLLLVIVGYLWLLLVICGYRWLSLVIVGYLWLSLVIHGCTIGSLVFKGTASGVCQIYHGKVT